MYDKNKEYPPMPKAEPMDADVENWLHENERRFQAIRNFDFQIPTREQIAEALDPAPYIAEAAAELSIAMQNIEASNSVHPYVTEQRNRTKAMSCVPISEEV